MGDLEMEMSGGGDMPRPRWAILAIAVLLLSSVPSTGAAEGRAVSCTTTDLGLLPGQFNIADQGCEQVALGSLVPGTVVEFDLSANTDFDLLVFRANALPVYANEQSYRSDIYWASETVFESLTGNARWHWTVPLDESETNWYVVLDNMAHTGDDGMGSQGGGTVTIDLDITFPATNYWTLHDGLVQLGVNSHQKLVDENLLILDEGSQISISGIPMSGDADVFILTENQRLSYLDGNSPEFRVTGADLLMITAEGSTSVTIDETHANQPLYLYVDNEVGPTGGGDGQTDAALTVVVTLLPVLDATISGMDNMALDVGESITLSANNTPNLSDQINTAAHEWDLDADGTYELTRSWAEIEWDTPGNRTVNLRVHGVDERVDTVSVTYNVADQTPPLAIINGGTDLVRGYSEDFTLASSSTDNHLIAFEEWWVNGNLHTNASGTGNSFTHSFGTPGNHTVTLKSFDASGLSDSVMVTVTVTDRTPPQPGTIVGPSEMMVGEQGTWSLNANDPQSAGLTWTWDFDRSHDADGDGDSKNDVQATGSQVSWTFNKAGSHSITATVTNDAGMSTEEEISVHVEAEPVSASSTSEMVVYAFGALGLLVLAVGAFLFYQRFRQREAHDELIQAEAARRAAEDDESAREPDHSEQLSMFSRDSNDGSGGWSGSARGDDMADIAGVGAGYGAQVVTQTQPASAEDAELLAAFDDPVEEAPAVEPEPEVKAEPKPAPVARASVLSSGIELPGVLHDVAKREATAAAAVASPASVDPTPAPAPTVAAAPSPAPAPVQASSATTEVTGACNACGQRYAVDMPEGISEARIDCPKCSARNTIRR